MSLLSFVYQPSNKQRDLTVTHALAKVCTEWPENWSYLSLDFIKDIPHKNSISESEQAKLAASESEKLLMDSVGSFEKKSS